MTWIGRAHHYPVAEAGSNRNRCLSARVRIGLDSIRVHVVSLTVYLARGDMPGRPRHPQADPLPRPHRRRLEPGRRGDLEHLEIVGVLDLGVDDTGRLVNAVAGLQPDVADPLAPSCWSEPGLAPRRPALVMPVAARVASGIFSRHGGPAADASAARAAATCARFDCSCCELERWLLGADHATAVAGGTWVAASGWPSGTRAEQWKRRSR